MLFISPEFIFIFLPITLIGFYVAVRINHSLALSWICIASLIFYMSSEIWFLWVLLLSIFVNYALSKCIEPAKNSKLSINTKKILLIAGIIFNLLVLGYFKYAGFFVENVNLIFNSSLNIERILLPLGISFYTFQQIGYIIDSSLGKTSAYSFLKYFTFVSFFPQLIAGPIVNHREMMPQLEKLNRQDIRFSNLSIGIVLFSIGFCKKVLFADSIAGISDHSYLVLQNGGTLLPVDAWISALSFYCQIYFDFSGYTDMAIGIARMFGIRLPINFHSPMQATSILDFWRRWHITLTRFTTAYVYMPLAVKLTRVGLKHNWGKTAIDNWRMRTLSFILPAFITFVLIGLWHGASWIYVAYGILHGALIVINYLWNEGLKITKVKIPIPDLLRQVIGRILTSFALIISLVLFKAPDFTTTKNLLLCMMGNSIVGELPQASSILHHGHYPLFILFICMLIIHCLPNSQEMLEQYSPAIQIYKGKEIKNLDSSNRYGKLLLWKFSGFRVYFLGTLFAAAALLSIGTESPFLYFDF